MKHFSRFQVLFAVGIFCLGLSADARAYADTYEMFTLATDTSTPYGIDDAGTVVVRLQGLANICGQTDICYQTYVFGVPTGITADPPNLDYDNGTGCTVPGVPVSNQPDSPVCNNGRELFTKNLAIFTGMPSDLTILIGGVGYYPMLNSMGDVLIDDATLSATYEFVDLTSRLGVAPEPSSLVLMATGVLSLAGATRRRRLPGF
jgi:hypothetical protein